MSKKNFFDCFSPSIAGERQLQLAAQILAILKMAGELQTLDWGFIIGLWAFGTIVALLKAAWKYGTQEEANAEGQRSTG